MAVLRAEVAEGLDGIQPGDELIVLTWLDRARRDVLRVHPRDDPANPEQGVFNTRSPDRPNPIGLHMVEVVAIEGTRLRVRNLEALDGTPVLDLKPVLRGIGGALTQSSSAIRPAARAAPPGATARYSTGARARRRSPGHPSGVASSTSSARCGRSARGGGRRGCAARNGA